MSNYKVLLYYKYINIDNPQQLMADQRTICEKLNLKGRIIIANEGINATVEGTDKEVDAYVSHLIQDTRFSDVHFKFSESKGNSFPKLSVKVRNEIVSGQLGEEDINPNEITGEYLEPSILKKWLDEKKELHIVDMRNDYEYKVGFFENSINPQMKNFRDLPSKLESMDHLRDKVIVTVCTGGVRCEKASGYLKSKGFNNVYQLKGGIQTFMEQYPNKYFKGKLYVFDGRVTIGFEVDSPEHEVVSNCENCSQKSDNYIDCGNIHCKGRRHFICCTNCVESGNGFCSENCKIIISNQHSDISK